MCEKHFEEYQLNQYDDLDYYESDYSEEDINIYFGLKYISDIINIERIFINEKNLYMKEINILSNIEIDVYNENIIDNERIDSNIRIKEMYNICRVFNCMFMTEFNFCNKHIEYETVENNKNRIQELNNRNKKNINKNILNNIDIYNKEISILSNIDIYNNDEYYFNKYEEFDMIEIIKENMELCYEYNCYNKIVLNEDLCKKHIDEQNIDDYDENGIKMVFKGYSKYKSKKDYLGEPNFHKGIIKFKYKGIKYNY